MDRKAHWQGVYRTKPSTVLSWYQQHSARSLALIRRTGLPSTGRIIDVGGGDSHLVDDLVARRYTDITVIDLSAAALSRAQSRLGEEVASEVTWIEGDVLDADVRGGPFDLWHDRAVFHFLTTDAERDAYIRRVEHLVRPGGHVIVATFAEDGPTRCSGLPVARYSPRELHHTFGSAFQLVGSEREVHVTPSGTEQRFTYCWCRYEPVHARA